MMEWSEPKYGVTQARLGPVSLRVEWRASGFVASISGSDNRTAGHEPWATIEEAKKAATSAAVAWLRRGLIEAGVEPESSA